MQTILQNIHNEKFLSTYLSKILGVNLQPAVIFRPEEIGAFGVNIKDSESIEELKYNLRQLIFSGLDSKKYWKEVNANNKNRTDWVYRTTKA